MVPLFSMTVNTTNNDTELSAVNSILAAIGQAPVSRIYNQEGASLVYINPEVSFAHTLLNEVLVDVQNEGWVFNREDHYTLTPDSDEEFKIPPNVLRMDISEGQVYRTSNSEGQVYRTSNVVRRDGKLYDKMRHTYKFGKNPISFDILWFFKFEDVPPVFQRYIAMRAAGRAAVQMVGNPQLVQLLQQQEAQLRAACMEYEANQGDYNFLGFPDNTVYRTYQPWTTLQRSPPGGFGGYIW